MNKPTQMPSLGFGTFRLEGDVAYQSVKLALETGFRHVDTAQIYGNEAEVGQAIADSDVAREDIFLTTKVWNDKLGADNFIASVEESLTKLKTSYVDLLLIHWPDFPEGVTLEDAVAQLAKAKELGLAKNIGVSNFTIEQVERTLKVLPANSLMTNQVEVHPYLQNQKLLAYCQEQGVTVTAYMPFAVGKVLKDETIIAIADKHNCQPAQVAVAWVMQLGMVTIPSSTKQANMETNLKGLDVKLDEEDMAAIAKLDCNDRQAAPDFSPEWD